MQLAELWQVRAVKIVQEESDGKVSFRQTIEDAELEPETLYNAANDLQRISKAEAIELLYQMAIDAGVTDALLNYGIFLWYEGKLKQAIPPLEQAYEADDQHAALTLGQIYFELNDAKTAITWFERSGDHPYLPVRLSRAYRSLGAENTALRILLEAKEENPEAAVELVLSGELEVDESIELLERHTDEGGVDVLIPLANLYGMKGRVADEIELLRRAVAAGEPNAVHNLGLALWQAGHRQEGRTLLKEAAQSGDQLAAQALHGLRRKRRKR